MRKNDNIDDLLKDLECLDIPGTNKQQTTTTGGGGIKTTPQKTSNRDEPSRKSLIDDLLKAMDESEKDDKPIIYHRPIPTTKPQAQPQPVPNNKTDLNSKFMISSIHSEAYESLNIAGSGKEDNNKIIDDDMLLKEYEMQTQKEKLTSDALKKIIEDNLKLPKAASAYKKNASPHEIVMDQLSKMQVYKKVDIDRLSYYSKLRVTTTMDFDPKKQYTEEEAKTMMFFKKSNDLVVLSVFTPEWLIGYIETKGDTGKDMETVKIFPITLVVLNYATLPTPKRTYEIKFWDTFGSCSDVTEETSKAKKFDVIALKSLDMSHLFKGTEAKPKLIQQANRDFNLHPNFKLSKFEDIPLLSFKKGDLIVVTKLANYADWSEGYLINSFDIKLGIFPNAFTSVVKLKLK
jgi:hypothetical protein